MQMYQLWFVRSKEVKDRSLTYWQIRLKNKLDNMMTNKKQSLFTFTAEGRYDSQL